ncbi:MAG: methionine aminotransferase [Acidobacteriota bacterium]
MSRTARRGRVAKRLAGFGTTVFTEMTVLAERHQAVNLGQGFPDRDGPLEIRELAAEDIRRGPNQYARMPGTLELTRAVADHQRRFRGLDYDPLDEITVTCGATEAIFVAIQALCDPGDEVVLFEPFYDSYRAAVAMAGAVDRCVALQGPDARLPLEALEEAISPRTRLLVLNSPHNPTGRVLEMDELEGVARLARRHDLIVLSDEVYEHLVYDDAVHRSIASLDGMRERTLVISSAGKTFSLTGWKIGWACGPPELSRAVRLVHQFATFCAPAPLQPAIARALALPNAFYRDLAASYQERRDLLCDGLREIGFGVVPPSGSYFVLADLRPLGYTDDVAFCRQLPATVGVAAIPPSAFTADTSAMRHFVRFAFCKRREVLEEGLHRLAALPRGEPILTETPA